MIAVGLAWLCERIRIPGAGAWRLGVWLLLLAPPYLSAASAASPLPTSPLPAWCGPWGPISPTRRGCTGCPRRRTAMVRVGSLTPALLAGCVLVFAETVSDCGVASPNNAASEVRNSGASPTLAGASRTRSTPAPC